MLYDRSTLGQGQGIPDDVQRANARLIVTAVNAHDDLMAACEAIIAGWGHQDGVSRAVAMARAALTKAKEGAP